MECFNSLLLKLREVHEREVEGWQMKIQELSNKKGCDTKRMEELFSKNQQMKEQQRLLTENIKTLENRLRAGLCDRCTVTQEVAKRRQLEFEAFQMQSLQHISLLAAEMNNLKKENKKFREEIRSLQAALEGHSDLSSSCSSTEVKHSSSPDLSPSSGPVALVSTATSRASIQPAGGDVSVKTEAEHRPEDAEHRQWTNRSSFESYKPLTSPPWKTEQHSVSCVGERSVEGLDQRPSIPPQVLPLRNSSSSSTDVNPSRPNLHPPAPCRPQPIKGSPVPLPWPLSESSDWVSAPGNFLVIPPHLRSNPPRFPSLIQGRRQAFGSPWHKQSTIKPPPKEPTVLFRLRSLPGQVDSQTKPQERKDIPASRNERESAGRLREMCEGPLDLSDRGKTKPNQTRAGPSPLTSRPAERVQLSPDREHITNPSAQGTEPAPSPDGPPSSSSSSLANPQEEEPPTDHSHTEVKEQRDELHGQTEQRKKVVTVSLHPVVVLETLNPALQKQESSNCKSSSAAEGTGSSSDGQDEEEEAGSGPESNQGCKRKRAFVEMDRDSETDNIRPERKIQSSVRTEEKSPS